MNSPDASGASVLDGTGADAAHLKEPGYESHFRREMKVWSVLTLGFTCLSPPVGIYSLRTFAIETAGPPALKSGSGSTTPPRSGRVFTHVAEAISGIDAVGSGPHRSGCQV